MPSLGSCFLFLDAIFVVADNRWTVLPRTLYVSFSKMASLNSTMQLNTGIALTSGMSENMGLVGCAHSRRLIILVSV